MKLEEHKAILAELNSDNIEPSRKMELITKLSDDYTVTQAEITTTTEKMTQIEKDRNHFAELSQKLWLENSTQLTNVSTVETKKADNENHAPKMTINDLMSKF
jgi:hypothetical protein